MSKTIWKYELKIQGGEQKISIPQGADILSCQHQKGIPCIWFLVDPNEPKLDRCFEIFETGHEILEFGQKNIEYIDTFQLDGGNIVLHVFERINC